MKFAYGALVDWYWQGKAKFSDKNCHMSSLGFNLGLHDERLEFLWQRVFLLINLLASEFGI
jgi:hypothetical protein